MSTRPKQAGVAAAGAAAAGAAVAAGVAIKRRVDDEEPRSYRLLEGEAVPEALRRIARGRIDHALDELRGKTDSSAEEAVHEARKDMKKLRALLRLARDELGDEVYRRENTCFRDAARALSGVRDADVMLGTLKSLDGSFPELRKALKEHRRNTSTGATDEVVATLEEARGRIDEWPLERDDFEALEGGLRRIYRRGRRAWRAVEDEPDTEILHEWRKREKDLWYHLTLFRESWPPVLKPTADEAHELSDRLGDDHDHAVLSEWAHDRFDDEALAGLDSAVAARRERLQREALQLGRRLYAERPRALVRRVGGYWEAWSSSERAAVGAS